ncbi:hypothetical protein C8R45DRAFT_930640 [Mycena sanguinolenta]|nr:hypothetical protein C8R45DRAFT_930640 [Mycena sanguinolenta]
MAGRCSATLSIIIGFGTVPQQVTLTPTAAVYAQEAAVAHFFPPTRPSRPKLTLDGAEIPRLLVPLAPAPYGESTGHRRGNAGPHHLLTTIIAASPSSLAQRKCSSTRILVHFDARRARISRKRDMWEMRRGA